jgi:hypothetical protein
LPEEWLIERIQQAGANFRNLFSPSFVVVCGIFAAVFRPLRDTFVTDAITSRAIVELDCFRFADFPDPDWTARRV